MLKRLTTKSQSLLPELKDESSSWSSTLESDIQEPTLILKKGRVYTCFQITSADNVNVRLISNIIKDVLHDSYYQSESISVIQSLEKAIQEVNERVSKLSNESISGKDSSVKLDLVACALWGNVIYFVKFGEGETFLMRDENIKSITTISEGNFSIASGIMKDGDVVILCTKAFAENFPPAKLLASSLSPSQLKENEACLILKTILDTSFSENEAVKIESELRSQVKPVVDIKAKITTIASSLFQKIKPKKREQKINSLISEPIRIRKENSFKYRFSYLHLIPIVLIALGISIFTTVKRSKQQTLPPADTITPVQETAPTVEDSNEPAFYDMRILDENARPTALALMKNTLVISYADGRIFTSPISNPSFEKETKNFTGLTSLKTGSTAGTITFTDSEGFKVYDLNTDTVTKDLKGVLGIADSYLDNVYNLSDGKIFKNKDTLWGESTDFNSAKDLDVAYSVYLITKDNVVLAYTAGEKSSFSLKNKPEEFGNLIKLQTDANWDNIYLADDLNKKIYVFDKEGNFKKEVKKTGDLAWKEISTFSVSLDEDKIAILEGNKLHLLDLDL